VYLINKNEIEEKPSSTIENAGGKCEG